MFKNILVPVDMQDAERARRIVGIGKGLMEAGGTLRLLHVVPVLPSYAEGYMPAGIYDDGIKAAREKVLAMAKDAGVEATIKVMSGVPHIEILEQARQEAPDLIIIGSHRPGLSDYFLGSTAARVVRHAQCPVLVDR